MRETILLGSASLSGIHALRLSFNFTFYFLIDWRTAEVDLGQILTEKRLPRISVIILIYFLFQFNVQLYTIVASEDGGVKFANTHVVVPRTRTTNSILSPPPPDSEVVRSNPRRFILHASVKKVGEVLGSDYSRLSFSAHVETKLLQARGVRL